MDYNNEIENKQNYLRNEILESDYDGDDFLNFMQKKKSGDATDLNNWTFPELKNVVTEYKHMLNSKVTNQNDSNNKITLNFNQDEAPVQRYYIFI
jgi:hypothetical protein